MTLLWGDIHEAKDSTEQTLKEVTDAEGEVVGAVDGMSTLQAFIIGTHRSPATANSPPKPFDILGVDLLGPLPQSTTGNRWILVAIDHTTRFVETAALPDATAECVARFLLRHIILRHGAPQVLITDRGHSFLAQKVEALLQACKVDHRTTSPYHPQTNGLTERFNHTLTKMISMYINSDHSNWDTILPFVTFA
ncbi:Integrase core domain protein [Ixodes scapularis]